MELGSPLIYHCSQIKRADAACSCFAQVAQPFDGKKFNFNKALQREVLFQFEAADAAGFDACAPVTESPNLVYINVSPIEYGHVLLVPRVLDCLPQVRLPTRTSLYRDNVR